jgi:cold shock protein
MTRSYAKADGTSEFLWVGRRPIAVYTVGLGGMVLPMSGSQAKERSQMQKGTVKFFNTAKGFGFITPESGGKDVFVHANDLGGAVLQEGTKVEFEVVEGKKGPQASGVKIV